MQSSSGLEVSATDLTAGGMGFESPYFFFPLSDSVKKLGCSFSLLLGGYGVRIPHTTSVMVLSDIAVG
jgi:hypothetical protein